MQTDWQSALTDSRAAWMEHYSSVSLPAWLEECLPREDSEDYSRESLTLLRVRYSRWLELVERYENHSEDFVAAFDFFSHHPAFWIRHDDEPTYNWKTSAHHLSLWFHVSRDVAGEPQFLFEAGGHVEPHYLDTYHDTRLDTVSRSYEAGIIKLAGATHRVFNVDGTSRVPVEVRRD